MISEQLSLVTQQFLVHQSRDRPAQPYSAARGRRVPSQQPQGVVGGSESCLLAAAGAAGGQRKHSAAGLPVLAAYSGVDSVLGEVGEASVHKSHRLNL